MKSFAINYEVSPVLFKEENCVPCDERFIYFSGIPTISSLFLFHNMNRLLAFDCPSLWLLVSAYRMAVLM